MSVVIKLYELIISHYECPYNTTVMLICTENPADSRAFLTPLYWSFLLSQGLYSRVKGLGNLRPWEQRYTPQLCIYCVYIYLSCLPTGTFLRHLWKAILCVSGRYQCRSFHRCQCWLTSCLTQCFYLAVDAGAVLASVDVGWKSHSSIIFLHLFPYHIVIV